MPVVLRGGPAYILAHGLPSQRLVTGVQVNGGFYNMVQNAIERLGAPAPALTFVPQTTAQPILKLEVHAHAMTTAKWNEARSLLLMGVEPLSNRMSKPMVVVRFLGKHSSRTGCVRADLPGKVYAHGAIPPKKG